VILPVQQKQSVCLQQELNPRAAF